MSYFASIIVLIGIILLSMYTAIRLIATLDNVPKGVKVGVFIELMLSAALVVLSIKNKDVVLTSLCGINVGIAWANLILSLIVRDDSEV